MADALNRDVTAYSHAFGRDTPAAGHPAPAVQRDDRHGLVFEWQPADVDGHPRLVSAQAALPRRRRPVLTGLVAAAIALAAWNYVAASRAARWTPDRADAAAHAMPAHELAALEQARARAERGRERPMASQRAVDE